MNDAAHQILIVYDNNTLKGDLIPAWGFFLSDNPSPISNPL